MCNIEIVLQKETHMNCFNVLISSCEFQSSLKEKFYNSIVLVYKTNLIFIYFSIVNQNPNGKLD